MGKKDKKRKQKTTQVINTSSVTPRVSQQLAPPFHKVMISTDTNSLASLLKRHRGTAQSTPLPPEWTGPTNKPFLTPSDGVDFTSCLQQCYRGFYWEDPKDLPLSLHSKFETTFDALQNSGLFLYDAVQPGGKKVSKTFVKRTLIGKPGSTYRYLGLRLFSHPWCSVSSDGDDAKEQDASSLQQLGYTQSCAEALFGMGILNQLLVDRTQHMLHQHIVPHVKGGLVGPADFTLTLVNRMEPTTVKRDLKKETTYGMGKTSVSWHKDSGLTDFSSIAVYHTLKKLDEGDDNNEQSSDEWRAALRVASSANSNNTPPLAVPLPSGALYYLLDDFNHNHEHAVLAGGNQLRYSSTHRVAREGRGTWQYIRDKCKAVLVQAKTATVAANKHELIKNSRAQQQLLTEIEFEWLRQWYIQGPLHAALHVYWHKPIALLEQYYQQLESFASETLELLQRSSIVDTESFASEALFDIFIESFEERWKAREAWSERLADPIFDSLPLNTKPIQGQVFRQSESRNILLDNVKLGVHELRMWRKHFVSKNQTRDKMGTSNVRADLTKKEKRKVASNWEQMKKTIGKTVKKSNPSK